MNQSVHGVWNLVLYRANEHAESYATLMSRLGGTRRQLCRIYQDAKLKGKDKKGKDVYVKLILTADKPFLCHAMGRRSFNHNYFSQQCDCQMHELYDLTHDLETHYKDAIPFETRCGRALVPLWEALDMPEPEDWNVYNDVRNQVHARCTCTWQSARCGCARAVADPPASPPPPPEDLQQG